jgi:hypothetical protein
VESDDKSSKAAYHDSTRPKQTPSETGNQASDMQAIVCPLFHLETGGDTNPGSKQSKRERRVGLYIGRLGNIEMRALFAKGFALGNVVRDKSKRRPAKTTDFFVCYLARRPIRIPR